MLASLRLCKSVARLSQPGLGVTARGYGSAASTAPVPPGYTSKEMESVISNGQLSSYPQVGRREWVGHGRGGMPNYFDCLMFPYPAIRFREWDSAYEALRQKEKGDWNNLSIEDKKKLYRHSFRYTFSELEAPTGRWKLSIGILMLVFSGASLTMLFIKKVFTPAFPKSFDEEWMMRSMWKQIMIGFNPVQGVSSKWDYENNRWKE
ncbi:hypothetical protein BOX15_Mlig031254g3 [Macrostomum lignano]|uniref:Cytochrome c oxidase subunit 4 n=2 Tax=Macrostomum lignano TaxID=282301 RepID=A0A1I8HUC8_9PLAT|nr:hypothetical protein BOX15_Mlig031254g3 [Macrostomum lignano]